MHDHDGHPGLHRPQRPAQPDHPMALEGGVVDGDTALMLHLLAEELLLTGLTPDRLRAMAHDPNYQALNAARCAIGDAAADAIIAGAARRVGVHRYAVREITADFPPTPLTVSASGAARTRGG